MVDLQFGRSFYKRNGFGPTVVYPPYVQNERDEVSLRAKIQEVLDLLSQTVEGVWKVGDIEISQERMNQWPENGNLLDFNTNIRIFERDKDGNILDNDVIDNNNDDLVADGDDIGPAPLQNAVEEEEIFETIANTADSSLAAVANAELAISTVDETMQRVARQGHNANMIFQNNNEQVQIDQNEVISTGGFADMNKTTYTWGRAFPTVFQPVFTSSTSSTELPRWMILHDMTGYHKARDKSVKPQQWYEYLMCRSDGIPAEHPTFSLVLYNHKLKNSLQKQGHFVLNISNMDPNTTLETIQNCGENNDQLRTEVDKLIKKTQVFSSNIVGTQPYWKATCHEFKATSFYNSYINNKHVSLFHTGSLAEHHEYPLRLLLHNYSNALNRIDVDRGGDAGNNEEINILNDDTSFS
jgi:hypothetical protein